MYTDSGDVQKMQCTICMKYKHQIVEKKVENTLAKAHSFMSEAGSTNFKKSTITDHEVSPSHLKAVSLQLAEEQKPEKSVAGRGLLAMKEKDRQRMRILFRSAHAIAKHNRPFTDYNWITRLDKAKGLTVGDTYMTEKACGRFIDNIGQVTQDSVLDAIACSNFFSMTMDGTTDVATMEQESIFIRMTTKGVVTTSFLKLVEPEGTTAEQLLKVIKDALGDVARVSSSTLTKQKLVGFTCDGAGNMLGRNKGTVQPIVLAGLKVNSTY